MMFDKIASDWYQKRSKPWKIFTSFFETYYPIWNQSKNHPEPNFFLDLGAGTGRHSLFLQHFCQVLVELDESREMLRLNHSNLIKIQATITSLPFRRNLFSGVCAIASLHHIQSQQNREKCIREIERICINGALIVITVWRFFQQRFKIQYLEHLHNLFEETFEIGDVQVGWQISENNNEKKILNIPRFYHLFRAGEFQHFIRPFRRISKLLAGDNNKKDNFFFFGLIAKSEFSECIY